MGNGVYLGGALAGIGEFGNNFTRAYGAQSALSQRAAEMAAEMDYRNRMMQQQQEMAAAKQAWEERKAQQAGMIDLIKSNAAPGSENALFPPTSQEANKAERILSTLPHERVTPEQQEAIIGRAQEMAAPPQRALLGNALRTGQEQKQAAEQFKRDTEWGMKGAELESRAKEGVLDRASQQKIANINKAIEWHKQKQLEIEATQQGYGPKTPGGVPNTHAYQAALEAQKYLALAGTVKDPVMQQLLAETGAAASKLAEVIAKGGGQIKFLTPGIQQLQNIVENGTQKIKALQQSSGGTVIYPSTMPDPKFKKIEPQAQPEAADIDSWFDQNYGGRK